jgi:hypothetical protein
VSLRYKVGTPGFEGFGGVLGLFQPSVVFRSIDAAAVFNTPLGQEALQQAGFGAGVAFRVLDEKLYGALVYTNSSPADDTAVNEGDFSTQDSAHYMSALLGGNIPVQEMVQLFLQARTSNILQNNSFRNENLSTFGVTINLDPNVDLTFAVDYLNNYTATSSGSDSSHSVGGRSTLNIKLLKDLLLNTTVSYARRVKGDPTSGENGKNQYGANIAIEGPEGQIFTAQCTTDGFSADSTKQCTGAFDVLALAMFLMPKDENPASEVSTESGGK